MCVFIGSTFCAGRNRFLHDALRLRLAGGHACWFGYTMVVYDDIPHVCACTHGCVYVCCLGACMCVCMCLFFILFFSGVASVGLVGVRLGAHDLLRAGTSRPPAMIFFLLSSASALTALWFV